jgi:hypothetical protein
MGVEMITLDKLERIDFSPAEVSDLSYQIGASGLADELEPLSVCRKADVDKLFRVGQLVARLYLRRTTEEDSGKNALTWNEIRDLLDLPNKDVVDEEAKEEG